MPRELPKYGLKLFALCDEKMFYIAKLVLCVRPQPRGLPYYVDNMCSVIDYHD